MNTGIPIGEFAAQTGLSPHTLRYYERIGLLDQVGRASSGHRRYLAEDLAWVEFLTRLRATGMPIRAMQQFAALRRQGTPTLRERRELLEAHQRRIEEHLGDLEANLEAITQKIEHYRDLEATDERDPDRYPVRARAGEAR